MHCNFVSFMINCSRNTAVLRWKRRRETPALPLGAFGVVVDVGDADRPLDIGTEANLLDF